MASLRILGGTPRLLCAELGVVARGAVIGLVRPLPRTTFLSVTRFGAGL